MAQVKNKNSRTQSVGETNYQNKMFQGQQFETVEEAIEAGAKAYAKLAWGEVTNFIKEANSNGFFMMNEEGLLKVDEEVIAQLLVESKRKTIIASMQKREEMPKAFA